MVTAALAGLARSLGYRPVGKIACTPAPGHVMDEKYEKTILHHL
jgi:hypothetical protein